MYINQITLRICFKGEKCIFEEDVKQYIVRQKDKTTHGIINFNVFLV